MGSESQPAGNPEKSSRKSFVDAESKGAWRGELENEDEAGSSDNDGHAASEAPSISLLVNLEGIRLSFF
jgi:hypothetical protein